MSDDHFVSWLHIGDLHVSDEDGWESVGTLSRIVTTIQAHVPKGALDFAFLPGDNANHGEPEQYARVARALEGLDLPVHAIPGDHDFEPGSLDRFYERLGSRRLPAMVRVAGRRALFLDIVSAGGGGPDFRLGDEQTRWLRTQLQEAKGSGEPRPLVFMHAFPGDLPREGAAVGRLFADAKVAFVDTGHTHYNELLNDGAVIYSATRSTGQIEEGPAGFAIAAVDGLAASWRFKPLESPWPWVLVTSPADARMTTGGGIDREALLRVRALILGRDIAAVEVRVDDEPACAMQPMPGRPGRWRPDTAFRQRCSWDITTHRSAHGANTAWSARVSARMPMASTGDSLLRELSCALRALESDMLSTLAVQNYRTLRDFVVPLGELNLITGANGSGKSNVYRALRLLADTAQGGVVASIAREGGLSSTLWAGPETITRAMRTGEAPIEGTRRQKPVSLGLGFASDQFSYAIDLGLPAPSGSVFSLDPVIKGEFVWSGPVARPAAMLVERRHVVVRSRDDDGKWRDMHDRLSPFDSMLSQLADPSRMPELLTLREQIRSWRFYDHFRTDASAPARLPQVGTHTPVLGHDGSDLAAALETIREIGDRHALATAVDDAFPGARVDVVVVDGRFETTMHQHGLLRPLKAVELSDGTLRYLLWIAALLSPRPPALLVLNEPETSLHPDLLPALGRLIAQAAKHAQVFVVSHAPRLIAALEDAGCETLMLVKEFGETSVANIDRLDRPAWKWMGR